MSRFPLQDTFKRVNVSAILVTHKHYLSSFIQDISNMTMPDAETTTTTTIPLDDLIEQCIGDFSWSQLIQATIVSLACVFDAQQAFISIFSDAQPKWSCQDHSSCNSNSINDICHLPDESWTWASSVKTSIISEWSLQCAGPMITGLPASSFFLGCLFGGFVLAFLGDSTSGRKNMLVLSTFVMSLAGALTAVSVNLWMYVVFRFISGFGRTAVVTSSVVLATELVGKKWRGNVGLVGCICFDLGFLSLPLVAFLLKGSSWRYLYLWTCIPSLVYSVLVYFLIPESPRWLFINGRKQEFIKTLRRIAPPAIQGDLTDQFFDRRVACKEGSSKEKDANSSMKMLLKTKWVRQRLQMVMVVALGIGMLYFGLPYGLGSLSVDQYLSVTINALTELPTSILAFLIIGKLNRKGSMLGFTLLSGICCAACVFVRWKGLQMALIMVSFFSGTMAFDVLILYTVELFPTCVRCSAMSLMRQAIVFGGVMSPVLAAAGRRNQILSFGVFGATIIVSGLCVVWLPETKGSILSDTIEEEEQKLAASKSKSNTCCV